jgi:hypothetical protein
MNNNLCVVLIYKNMCTVQMDSLYVTSEQAAELEEATCEMNGNN